MGDPSRITGQIRIEPPLRWSQYRRSPYLAGTHDLMYVEDVETTETDGGTVTTRTAIGIEAIRDSEPYNYRTVEGDLRAIVAEITALELHTTVRYLLSGFLVEYGIESVPAAVFRFRVDEDRAVLTEKASVRWPDGTEVEV